MTLSQAIKSQWKGVPQTHADAQRCCRENVCAVCGSDLILPIVRPPMPDFKAHCNHCGSEVPLAVMLNQTAWSVTAPFRGYVAASEPPAPSSAPRTDPPAP